MKGLFIVKNINVFKDKVFLRNLIVLIIPIILQGLLNSSINLIDSFMVGRLGEVAITAVGIANQIFFVFNITLFGINSGASVFIGQYFGKNDINGIHKSMGISVILGLLNALIFFLAVQIAPKALMSLYSNDDAVILEATKYLRIIGGSYFITAIASTLNETLKSTRKTSLPMITTFIALITNAILNYIFMFKLDLGVVGAALATFIARCVELLAQIILIGFKKLPIIVRPRAYINFNAKFIKGYFVICAPVILNEIFWSLGVSICNMAYRFSGTDAQSAIQISSTVQNLFAVMGIAVGNGCGILLANSLGSGDIKRAIDYSKKCIQIAIIIGIIMGVCLIITAPIIISMFNVKDIVKDYTYKMLFIVSIGIVIKVYNYTTIVGILRNGGDTVYTAILEFCTVWFIAIPMAFIGAYFLKLPIYVTFGLVYLEEFVKMFLSQNRVKKNKWAKSLV